MKAIGSAAITVALVGCAVMPFDPPAAQVEVIVVNGSGDEVAWVIEQPNGLVDRLPVQACSAHANGIDPRRGWRLEVAGEAVAISDQVAVLDAPVTVVQLDISPDGEVVITGPVASDRFVDVPIRFPCASN